MQNRSLFSFVLIGLALVATACSRGPAATAPATQSANPVPTIPAAPSVGANPVTAAPTSGVLPSPAASAPSTAVSSSPTKPAPAATGVTAATIAPAAPPASTATIAPTADTAVKQVNALTLANAGIVGVQVDPESATKFCQGIRQDRISSTPLWVPWVDVDPSGTGRYNWTKVDGKIEALHNCGLDLAFHVQAITKQGGRASFPTDIEAYKRWLTALVNRYKGRVSRYSIENEAISASVFEDTPENYFRLLDIASQAIHAADPHAIVEDAGVSSEALGAMVAYSLYQSGQHAAALTVGREVMGDSILKRFHVQTEADLLAAFQDPEHPRVVAWLPLELKHLGSFDAFQIHYYGPSGSLPTVIRWLRAQGMTRPIEIWELNERYFSGVDDKTHAQDTVKLLVTAAGEGSQYTIFLRYVDWLDKFLPGLVTEAGVPHPADAAYRTVNQYLAGFTGAAQLDLGPSAWGYRFTRPAGDLYVVWSTSGQVTVKLPLAGKKVTDITGAAVTADPANLPVGPSPLFIQ